jgi:predicted kinase
MKPKMILVTGLPASGKSWLANELSKALRTPQITKDGLKVAMLKELGVRDRAWDVQIGTAAIKIQMQLAIEFLQKGIPIILESNFKQEFDAPLILEVIKKTSCDCLQIVCSANGDVLVDRYVKRTSSSDRPKELNAVADIEIYGPILKKGYEPLKLPGQLMTVDTNNFEEVDLSTLTSSIAKFLNSRIE